MINIFAVIFLIFFSSSTMADNRNSLSVSVMTYNLENLFDSKHDVGKNDWTYLPLDFKNKSSRVQAYCATVRNPYYKKNCFELDWSFQVVLNKISNLSEVIKLYDNGRGADIIVFQEVENLNVLKMLVKYGLAGMGYKYVNLIEGPDTRGIDVGFISRFPVISKKIHTINLAPHSSRTTRPITEMIFKVGSKTVTIFGNHWPSQGNIDETRIIASKILKNAAFKSKSDVVLALGDFNTSEDDLQNGIKENLLPYFIDVEVQGRQYSKIKAMGTHWFRGNWESLDRIFVLKKSLKKSNAKIDYFSFEIAYKDFMLTQLEWTDRDTGVTYFSKGIPNRYNPKLGEGYSDHLPVAISIDL